MSMNRRQFLKIAGLSTVAGLGGASLLNGLSSSPEASQVTPGPGALTAKRWGFVVDVSKLKSADDYRKCINACHDIHNVPNFDNPKEEIKWIWTDDFEHTFPGTEHHFMNEEFRERKYLVFCNHCAKPACVRVCPTKATFKRKSDGIVMMDMHRCIGCRFCMAACPYGARSFNFRDPRPALNKAKENPEFPTRTKGVVEKCTACYERLAVGKIPACVEASNGAIIFGDLEDPNAEIRKVLASTYTIRRKPELGTDPSIFYVIGSGGGEEHA